MQNARPQRKQDNQAQREDGNDPHAVTHQRKCKQAAMVADKDCQARDNKSGLSSLLGKNIRTDSEKTREKERVGRDLPGT